MENNVEYEFLKKIENNITNWYPFEENIKYIILKDFSKDKINELETAVNELEENSKIILMLDNDLGIKNVSYDIDKERKLFNRKEIEELLDRYGLTNKKFYYPLPNWKTPNVIFTDLHLPDQETISRNIQFFQTEKLKKNEENVLFKKILNQDIELFKIYANSFLIECSKIKYDDNKIEFISFSNMRKENYRIQTTIKDDKVFKIQGNEQSKQHIRQIKNNIDIMKSIGVNTLDRYENDIIISNYQKNRESLDKLIINMLKQNQIENVEQIIRKLFKQLKEKLHVCNKENNVFDKYNINYNKEKIQELTFVKYGFWDAIFQNIFYIDDEFYFYDQEWMEENLPIEFIIYRAFKYMPRLSEYTKLDEMFYEFNINEQSINIFEELDNKLQETIRSEISWSMNNNCVKMEDIINKVKDEKEKILDECKKNLNEKDARIKFLEDNMEQTCDLLKKKEEEILMIKESLSWKITEPLRKLKGKNRKKL